MVNIYAAVFMTLLGFITETTLFSLAWFYEEKWNFSVLRAFLIGMLIAVILAMVTILNKG